MDDKLAEALSKLLPEDGPPSAQELADVLWVARFLGRTVSDEGLVSGASGPSSDLDSSSPWPTSVSEEPPLPDASSRDEQERHSQSTVVDSHESEVPLHVASTIGQASARATEDSSVYLPAAVVRLSREGLLHEPLELSRALRPLKVQRNAPGWPMLDEEATATASCEASMLMPSWLPRTERLFSVDLVVDTGPSMRIWQQLAAELRLLLESHGAFRVVRTWTLNLSGPKPRVTPFRRSSHGRTEPGRSAHQLAEPAGRRVLLLLTDGVGEHWRRSEFRDALSTWCRSRPAAILHVLSQRVWHRTAIHAEPALGWPAPTGSTIPVIRPRTQPRGATNRTKGTTWVPVLEVDANWLRPWAGLVGRVSHCSVPLLALPLRGDDNHDPGPGPGADGAWETLSPEAMVEHFRGQASTGAYELAGYLAAVPLVLPVMRMVQRTMMPTSPPAHLAEVFLSGLLVPDGSFPNHPSDPDLDLYDFRPGIRDVLLGTLTRTEALQVLNVMGKVSGRVARRFGGTLNFRALIPSSEPGREWQIPVEAAPFAQVATTVLSRLGGDFAELAADVAARLTSGQADATARTCSASTNGAPPDFAARTIGQVEQNESGLEGAEVQGPAATPARLGAAAPLPVALASAAAPQQADRLLLHVSTPGALRVTWWPAGSVQPAWVSDTVEMTWPLQGHELEELRWYLEEYLRAPFGVYGERGPQVAAQLQSWGEKVFEAVFGTGSARDAYMRARTLATARRGSLEIVVISGAPGPLGWPWELIAEPGRQTPLALDEQMTVSRTMPTARLGDVFITGGSRLRILMVISRPHGTRDTGYQMIARPLLHRLKAVRGQVEVVVLRPPTLEHLQQMLGQAWSSGEPFHIVHFDGHGVFGQAANQLGRPAMPDGQGMLAFEKPDGDPDLVPAGKVAWLLKQAQVPVVVLNACQSAAVGSEVEAGVATRLLQEGTAAVVAMASGVYAVAAAEFMAVFYERLFAGDRVTEAVAAGRRHLAKQDLRPSPKGMMPLADWVVPVLYSRSEVNFLSLRAERETGQSLEELLDQIREGSESGETGPGDALEAVGAFIGRDALLYTLDVAARRQRVVVLHGPGGTGKTELAKSFARWWRDTGALDPPDEVIWHSFEPGVASFGLDGVITSIGLHVFGTQFALLDPAQRQTVVEEVLRTRRLLLVWDNFESVQTMPDPSQATPQLADQDRDALRAFLVRIAAHGRSAVVITSRTAETWLGPEIRRVEVPGLDSEEASQYADYLLAPYPNAQLRREAKAFGELMHWLDGHPLSMRIVLPHLNTTSPSELMAGLQGSAPLPDIDSGDRTTSLSASITYSFTHLAASDQQTLTALSLLCSVADTDVLGLLSAAPDVPEPFSGRTAAEWTELMDRAAGVGLLTPLGAGMYRIHPALPAYLVAHWQIHAPDAYREQHAATTRALLDAHAVFGQWLTEQINSGDAQLAMALISYQQRTLGTMLGYALDHSLWQQARAIIDPLNDYWNARGLMEEAGAWVDRARLVLETPDGVPPDLDTPEGALWLFLSSAQAEREIRAHRLDQAEHTFHGILNILQQQPTTPQRHIHLATTYHQLGNVAQQRGRLEEAEDWYRQALTIDEELGNRPGTATAYHQLGNVAQQRGRLEEAEDWYRQALTIAEELGNRPGTATAYHQLGSVAEDRRRLEEAEDWYRQALTIDEELGNRPGTATAYHQLGNVAQQRGRLDEAEDWYRQALTIDEELGNRPGTATTYHQLGNVAQQRGRLDEAEDWYRQTLTIAEELGNRPGTATAYHQLGNVAQQRGRLDEAEDWYRQALTIYEELGNRPGTAACFGEFGLLAEVRQQPQEALAWTVRCVALFDQFPHPVTGRGPDQLRRLSHTLGVTALEQTWQTITGRPLPPAVRRYVTARPPAPA
ncbi:SAV_2336 N-terminal domain-related protein [Streptomyces sp. NPDC002088]|uniref:SAV_2336 N-terminal domain-related protein n=1 Tax=Streptomyces sp. NPDC002088 TaxID=3154665 RepID=UPI003319C2F8